MNAKTVLQHTFKLDHNIKLYIPSTDNVNEATDNSKYIAETLKAFSQWFGGATSYDAIGAWYSGSKGIVTEPVKIIESYATAEAVSQHIAEVLQLAERIKAELHQEAVSLEYDRELYLV